MIIRFINKLLIAALIIMASGCTNDKYLMSGDDNSPEGKMRMELQLYIAQSETQSTTRSGDPEQVLGDDVYIMVLDGKSPDSRLKQVPARAVDINNNKIYAVLSEENTPSYLYILSANMSDETRNYLNNSAIVGTTLKDLEENIKLAPATVKGLSSPLPMSGSSEEIAQIKKGTSYTNGINMVRAVARIDVVIDSTILPGDFTLTGLALANGAKDGWLLPKELVAQNGASVVQYEMVVPNQAQDQKIESKIYCYENKGQSSQFTSNPTKAVVKGRYNGGPETYYGINIAYKLGGDTEYSYDIERNKIYTIRVNKVQKSGYNTLEEAVKNSEFNMAIEAEITVTDPYAHDVITNGKQYLGATNSDFLVHPNKEDAILKGVKVATISYTTESSWSIGQITLPAGLTFSDGNTGRLELSNGNIPVVKEIIVDISTNFREGDIAVNIGNLAKSIHVKRSTAISPLGGVCEDFASPNYKVGEVANFSESTAWLKLSDQQEPQGESSLMDQINNPQGGIYVHYKSNIGFEQTASSREAQLYISGGQGKPRSRILIQQDAYEVYHDARNVQIEKAYVGTFHRWNQTAERIIRIDASKYNTEGYKWAATVVSGSDFIVLSTEKPRDSNIYTDDPFGAKTVTPQYSTDEQIEANCQVDGNAITVNGTGKYIYFKVGLKSRLSSPQSQPRYGLISIVHAGGNHLIYVRQGEAADYLMRPWDEWKEGSGSGFGRTRNKAVKISPYNLTDPQKSRDYEIDRGKRGYDFTQYPSQGGYYFMSNSTKAYPRIDGNTERTGGTNTSDWSTNFETCPQGYRRPKDMKGAIDNSEMRVSFWLYPQAGEAVSSLSNQYRGYLADGFFDRRPIVNTRSTSESTQGLDKNTIVMGATSVESAYQGTLFFNPRNLASVFMPEAGNCTRDIGAAGIHDEGFFGGYYTSTMDSRYKLMNIGFEAVTSRGVVCDMYTTNYDFGWSIRCVKDENPPILNDGENNINPFPEGPGTEVNLISQNFKAGTSLQSQLESDYSIAELQNMYTLNLYGDQLADEDYAYLNSLATNAAYPLRHLIISGRANKMIPANAFTSPKWVSISLVDATIVKADAFHIDDSASGYQLKNIKFGSYDAITIEPGVFNFPANLKPAESLNLFLAGNEYKAAKDSKVWGGITWLSVKNYYGKKQ